MSYNGDSLEVPRITKTSDFEFWLAAKLEYGITMVEYCPVSYDIKLCLWEILLIRGPEAPQFQVVF